MQTTHPIRKLFLLMAGLYLLFGHLTAQKLLESIVTYSYPSSEDSVRRIKIANEYDGAGWITSHSIYTYNTNPNRWEGSGFPCEECSFSPGRFEYVYDEQGNQVSSGVFSWSPQKREWVQQTFTTMDYDDWGNNIFRITTNWDSDVEAWIPVIGQEFGYDDEGRITSSTAQRWIPTQNRWVQIEKMQYTFNLDGRTAMTVKQKWDDELRNWVNQNKTEWNYDTAGIQTEIITYHWGKTGNDYNWKVDNIHRWEYLFDAAGHLIMTTDFVQTSENSWKAIYKVAVNFNEESQPILSVTSEGFSGLQERLRTEWVYDPSGKLSQEIQTGWLTRREGPLPMKNKLRVHRSFDSDGDITRETWYYWEIETDSYLLDGIDYFFYHPISTGIDEIPNESIQIYPNPTEGMVNLSGWSKPVDVKIYSVFGKLVKTIQKVTDNLDMSDLVPGTYLVLVSEANSRIFRTILIKQ